MSKRRDLEAVWEQRAVESRPLLDALEPLGYTEQDWEVGAVPTPAVAAVLIEHLDRPHPEHVHSWSARILGQLRTDAVWAALASTLERTSAKQWDLHQSVTASLAHIAARKHLPQVLAYLADESLGGDRIFFYRTLTRLRAPRRWEIIEAGLADPKLREEAAHLLHQRELRAARAHKHA